MGTPPSNFRRVTKSASANSNFGKILQEFAAATRQGRRFTDTDRIAALAAIAEQGGLPSLQPLLPLMLNLKGEPYSIDHGHFHFAPLFRIVDMPPTILFMTGRQVSKSTSIAADGVMKACSMVNPKTGLQGNFTTLYVMPRYEQIRRFSTMYVRPFIEQSPVKSLWISTGTENSVLQRTFHNNSRMIFSFALLDADRCRGISSDRCSLDEIQDMDPDHIPIIAESMSHSPWRLMQFTGTPKTLDNPIQTLWQRSSQAEWWIPCDHCTTSGKPTWNIPCREFHVDRMLGPWREDISEELPGLVCFKCGKSIRPRTGRWKHRFPDKILSNPGYHVPQCIMPIHYATPKAWGELLKKQHSLPVPTFWNEVMGESAESGVKLVTQTDLMSACKLPWRNNPRAPSAEIERRLSHYETRLMCVDWGGGGEDTVSFTTLAVLGYRPTGEIDVLWGKRLLNFDHMAEAQEIRGWMQLFKCHGLTHDYTGAGTIRETILQQVGLPYDRNFPIAYCSAASGGLMQAVPARPDHPRNYWRVDKTRSLLYTCQAIKLNLINFFQWEEEEPDFILRDFLALCENKVDSMHGSGIFTITHNMSSPDDFAHSVNLGAMCLWNWHDSWPDFGSIVAAKAAMTGQQMQEFGHSGFGWEQDERPDSEFINDLDRGLLV